MEFEEGKEKDRFSEHLVKVIEQALRISREYGIAYVGSEQFILAMLRIPECGAAKLLHAEGVTLKAYTELLRNNLNRDYAVADFYTPRAKRALRQANLFARQDVRNRGFVHTEHLLYAIITNEDCLAVRLLVRLQVDNSRLIMRTGKFVVPTLEESPSSPNDERQPEAEEGTARTLDESLLAFGTDLTQRAREGKIDPVIGRSKEIEKVIQILSRRTKNNPVLIGEPGVGKSAVVEGLALAIADGNVPALLRGKIVYSLNITGLMAGTRYRGDFEERMKTILDAVTTDRDIILFIDEIHTIIGAGSGSEGSLDAANILKPMLARGELQTIGATTLEEYRKYIEKDPALERRFTPVIVEQPSVEDTIIILKGLKDKYESHHLVVITDEAIEAAARLSDRYITDRFLPDKAIDLIDEAASRARLNSYNVSKELREAEEERARLYAERANAHKWGDYARAGTLTGQIEALSARIAALTDAWHAKQNTTQVSIGLDDIAEVVSGRTGVPVTKLTEAESERLMHLEEELHRRIVGQDEAVTAVARAVRRARAGLKDPNRPIGCFIFVGPTGVGKTDLCKALAETLFGDERLMIRLDMSEYMEKGSTTKLIGAPPGHVGFDDAQGTLTEKIRRKPYSVVLFDEIEKAHPDVFNLLLQIFDDGRLTDSRGRTSDFKNTIIVLTSNVGAHVVKESAFGFAEETEESAHETLRANVEEALKKQFRPEFLNRLDDIIVFHRLSYENAAKILDKILMGLAKRLEAKRLRLRITDRARRMLLDRGYSDEYGARPLKRIVQKEVEDGLSEQIILGKVKTGGTVLVDVDLRTGKIIFDNI